MSKPPSEVYQHVLPSGRGVRVKRLRPRERDQLFLDAATEAGEDATGLEIRFKEVRLGCLRTLVQVTKTADYKARTETVTNEDGKPEKRVTGAMDALVAADQEATAKGGSIWKDISLKTIEDDYDEFFTARDDAALNRIFRLAHELSQADLDMIVGKELAVSTD